MSSNMSATHAADTEYLVRQSMNAGYQWASALVPPAYIAYIITRRGRGDLSLNRILRTTWIGGLAGAAATGGIAYLRYAYSNEQSVRAKRVETAYNVDNLRRNDHSTIGGILGAILTPALFWKRANIANLILGGAGLGSAAGLLAHYARTVSGDPPVDLEIIIASSPE